jgi:leucyl aminopeptidase
MKVTVDSRAPVDVSADLLALPMSASSAKRLRLEPRLAALDRASGGQIRAAFASGDFSAKKDQMLLLYGGRSLRAKRILLLGLGDASELDTETLRRQAGQAVSQAMSRKARRVALAVPREAAATDAPGIQALAEGAVLADYRFEGYRENDENGVGHVSGVSLLLPRGSGLTAARRAARTGSVLAESQNTARQLSDMPGNALPPAELASAARRMAREVGLRVRVLGVPELKRRKMGAILAVGQGSVHPPRLIALEHRPRGRGKAGAAPVCLVGKGITFDSGGISIKPSANMHEMKHDMSGAAAVVGALRACALLELPIPVVGVIGAAENLPGANAYRPGDVVRSMSGKTIEVLNTDAEGRVVLADALHFACEEFAPSAIVDLATLTGACMMALGGWATGLFGNSDALIEIVRSASEESGERAWPLPLFDGHKKAIRSEVADIKNIGGRTAGASTAAAFLSHFVGDTPWVHLDIAGTGWTGEVGPYQRHGATGVGVRLLLQMLRNWDPNALS